MKHVDPATMPDADTDIDDYVIRINDHLFIGRLTDHNVVVAMSDVPELISVLADYLDEGALAATLTDLTEIHGIKAMRIEQMP